MMTFRCGPMEPGKWQVRFWQRKISQPLIYNIAVTIFPPKSIVDVASPQIDLLQTDWQLEKVILVSGDPHPEMTVSLETTTPTQTTTTRTTTTTTSTTTSTCSTLNTAYGTFYDWLVCGGGLVTMALGLQFAYFWSRLNKQIFDRPKSIPL